MSIAHLVSGGLGYSPRGLGAGNGTRSDGSHRPVGSSLLGPAWPRHLDFERVVEAVEIVKQADDADEFDELPLVIGRGDGVPYFIGDVAVVERDRVGQSKCGGFGGLEVSVPSLRVFERIQVLLSRSLAPCQGAVTRGSIPAFVEDGHAHGEQFFELRISSGFFVPQRIHVIIGSLHRRWATGIGAEHVGHVVARFEKTLQHSLRLGGCVVRVKR
jgi:hypothetical protein